MSGTNTWFEFGRRLWMCVLNLCIKHHKRQKILQTDKSFVFLFLWSFFYFTLKDELCFQVQRSLSTDFRMRIMPFLIIIFEYIRNRPRWLILLSFSWGHVFLISRQLPRPTDFFDLFSTRLLHHEARRLLKIVL